MLLTKKLYFNPTKKEQIILNSLCYASAKLWNIGNYEKKHYEVLGIEKYPNWYNQKKCLKNNFWYKNLPSQTAQEVLNELEQSWKSFFKLLETKKVENPNPPKFKKKNSKHSISYLNNGFQIQDNHNVRFSLPKQLKNYLKEQYAIEDNYLTLKIRHFSSIEGNIKQIKFKPLKDNNYEIYVVYEIENVRLKKCNSKYLSIDIGINNLFTCYDNIGYSFIIKGSDFLNVNYYYNKKIAYYQSISYAHQVKMGAKYGKDTKRIKRLYKKKSKRLEHIFHSATKQIVDYCITHDINKVVIGDINGIRHNANLGYKNNQKLHSLPYNQIYALLTYKLARQGIELIKQKENYSSQCSPFSKQVNKKYATPQNRTKRGLYIDDLKLFNADSVGSFNILRLYKQELKKDFTIPIKGLSNPDKINVPV